MKKILSRLACLAVGMVFLLSVIGYLQQRKMSRIYGLYRAFSATRSDFLLGQVPVEKLLKDMDRLLRYRPSDPGLRMYILGACTQTTIALWERKEYPSLVGFVDRALEYDPPGDLMDDLFDPGKLLYLKGRSLVALDRKPEARAAFSRLLQYTKDPSLREETLAWLDSL